jgi:AraC-like DNA-binding protein
VNLYHDESSVPDEEVYFPQQLENGILEAIRTGQIGDLQKALEHINRENIERRKLTHYAQTILVSRYQELLLKASQKNKVQDSALRDSIGQLVEAPHQDVGRFIAETEACLVRLAEAFGKDRSRKDEEDADRISDHLKRNFGDNQLSLLSTSDALGYSVPYINRLVKKYYGKTFRNYMEDLRMDLVRDLIVSTDTPFISSYGREDTTR